MNIKDFAAQFPAQQKKLTDYVLGDQIKKDMGDEAVNHFKASFQNEGFTDESLDKWAEVERRKPESEWYKKGKASTGQKILSGGTGELQNSINYALIDDGVRITDAAPYASVHNFGEGANVYGKKPFIMKKRQIIGKSAVMIENIENKIAVEIDKIIKQNS